MLPDPSLPIRIGDEVLFAGTREAFEDVEYIMENIYELHYVMQGKECEISLASKLTLDF
jgi:hypothetical protein